MLRSGRELHHRENVYADEMEGHIVKHLNRIVCAEGVETSDNILFVAEWATEKIRPAELVLTGWDSDGSEVTDKKTDTPYYIRVWDWSVRGKKRISVTASWTLFRMGENGNNTQLDTGFVEIRNGEVCGGSHSA